MFWDDDNGEAFDAIAELIQEVMGIIGDMPEREELDFEGFAEKSSGAIDRLIIDKMQQGNKFVAGRFNIVYVDDDHFKFTIEIYFHDPRQNDYIRLDGASGLISMRKLKADAREVLKRRRTIAYEVNAPVLPNDDTATRNN